jgi:hypothetical protein
MKNKRRRRSKRERKRVEGSTHKHGAQVSPDHPG